MSAAAQDRIRVVTADDQRIVREGLALVLSLIPGVEVVGAAEDGEQAIRMVGELRPDVILMDLRMPRCEGVQATRRITAQFPATRVLVLTTYADDQSVLSALKAGAVGYLTKDAGAEQIEDALRRIVRGEAVVDPAVQRHLVQAVAGDQRPAPPWPAAKTGDGVGAPVPLTSREEEVLVLIAHGQSNAAIAELLLIGEATVKSHVSHILAKTGARDRAHAVSYAYLNGLLDQRRAQ